MLPAVSTPASRAEPFLALAGLRGVAALVVVQFHGSHYLGGAPLAGGYMAVDFFFLLSGWVLAHAYDRRFEAGMTAGQFMRLRLIRLYPVYLLALLATVAGSAAFGGASWQGLALSLVFLPILANGELGWVIAAAWSLAAELAVNLPFAILHRRLNTPVLLATVLVSLAGLIGCGLPYGSLDVGHSLDSWPGLFARVFFSFPLGVLLYRHRMRLTGWAPAWSSWPSMALLVLALSVPAPAGLHVARDAVIIALVLPAILLFASSARPHPLTARIATWLGEISYPLYLLHVAVFVAMNVVLLLISGQNLRQAPIWLLIPLLAVPLLVAWTVDRWFDRPIRRYLLTGSRVPSPSPSPAA